MLVLSRKVGEQIVFPGLGITIEVVKIRGQRARLGITAPEDVNVARSELGAQPTGEETPDNNPNQPGGE